MSDRCGLTHTTPCARRAQIAHVCDIIYILSLVSAEITDWRTTGCPVILQANEGSLPFSVRE